MKNTIVLLGMIMCVWSCSNGGSSRSNSGTEAPTGQILGQVPNHDLSACPNLNGQYSLGASNLIIEQKQIGNYLAVKTITNGIPEMTFIDGNIRQKGNAVEVGYCPIQNSMISVISSPGSMMQVEFSLDGSHDLVSNISCQPETATCKTGSVTWKRTN